MMQGEVITDISVWCVQGGAQQVSELLAKCIGRDNVRLGEPVSAIEQVKTARLKVCI